MRNRFILLLALCGVAGAVPAAVLPPEKLLPRDTALMITVPDTARARDLISNTPYGLLWHDPAIKPFKSKFVDKFSSDVMTPLGHNFGVQLSDYQGLAQGQMTFALLPLHQPKHGFAQIFLLDSKDHAAQLRSNLAAIKKKWGEAGKAMHTQKIRDVEFTTLIGTSDDLSWSKIFPKAKSPDPAADDADKPAPRKVEIMLGQIDSLLIVSDSAETIEKVLSRQAGGLVPGLDEEPSFQADFAARLHGAPFYAWLNAKIIIDSIMSAPARDDDNGGPSVKPTALLNATGLSGVTSACLAYRVLPEGLTAQLFVGAPESSRRGLLKALSYEHADASPPSFVPGDAVKFWRWRINIPHAWTQIESTLNEVNPQASGLLNFIFQSAGKDKDENYNLKSRLLDNLGDDIIHYEKVPRGTTLDDLKSAPAIYLIGSPNPEKLAAAMKVGLGFLAQGTGGVKERDFLGRKIYSVTFPTTGRTASHPFSFAGSSGYLALSGNAEILEEFLRSGDNKGKVLRETPGLAEAAQKAGGMGTGLFGFNDQSQNMRFVFESLRQQPITLNDILGTPSMPGPVSGEDQVAKLREWADFSLLPPFEAISKYFYYSVYTGGFSPEGFTVNFFAPTPPKLR